MPSLVQTAATSFTAGERDYIRRELDVFLSIFPIVADGFLLKTWRTGPHGWKPKILLTAQGLLDRGLLRLDVSQRMPRLLFTDAGLAELRALKHR